MYAGVQAPDWSGLDIAGTTRWDVPAFVAERPEIVLHSRGGCAGDGDHSEGILIGSKIEDKEAYIRALDFEDGTVFWQTRHQGRDTDVCGAGGIDSIFEDGGGEIASDILKVAYGARSHGRRRGGGKLSADVLRKEREARPREGGDLIESGLRRS